MTDELLRFAANVYIGPPDHVTLKMGDCDHDNLMICRWAARCILLGIEEEDMLKVDELWGGRDAG